MIYLYGHTGSVNHGCEAIVRSTWELLHGIAEITLVTTEPQQDERFGIEKIAKLLPFGKWDNQAQRVLYAVAKRLLKNQCIGQSALNRAFWKEIKKGDVCLCIGGDTYCYGYPPQLYSTVNELSVREIPAVLWGCSIIPENITPTVVEHFNKYQLIVAREGITTDALVAAGVEREKVLHTCDPAFGLQAKECQLPEAFSQGDVVGINVSGFLISNESEEQKAAFTSVEYMLHQILTTTGYPICLIPHVYGKGAYGLDDVYWAEQLYGTLSDEEKKRVTLLREEMSCEKLKYIISNCRFFVGARTHSVIAAYSTAVPALALGYSVKAHGIATDLFGTDKGYVLGFKDLSQTEKLWMAFSSLMEHEQQVRDQYEEVLPGYKNTIFEAVKRIEKMEL